jgi:hypothetical protein
MLELDKVMDMWNKLKKAEIKPNKLLLNAVLETGMRKENTAIIIEALENFI